MDNVSMSAKSALEANGAIHGFVFYIVQSLREGLLTALERRHKRQEDPANQRLVSGEPDGCADVAAESPNEMRQAAVLLLLRAESNEHILRSAMQALNVALVRPNSIQLDYPICL